MNEPKLDDITLRDLFAMFALASKAGSYAVSSTTARAAYAIADAMLEERARSEEKNT